MGDRGAPDPDVAGSSFHVAKGLQQKAQRKLGWLEPVGGQKRYRVLRLTNARRAYYPSGPGAASRHGPSGVRRDAS